MNVDVSCETSQDQPYLATGPAALSSQVNESLLYQPDERPGHLASLSHGFQFVVTAMGSMVAVASIVSVAGGQSDDYLAWILFGSMAICGIGSILQTFRFWRFGSGYPIGVNSGSSFIAVCTTILLDGGPAMLSTLIVASALLQFVFISKLSLLRRFITPTVSGTVIMLVSATIISVVLSRLTDMPEDAPAVTAPVLAGITLIVLLGTRMFGSPKWQQWGPIIAIITGCAVAAFWGLYDFQRVIDAPWVGIPTNQWPGFDLSFNATFWALLPGLVIVIMASTVRSISDTVTIQQVAWRRPRATDFRVVQGAHYLVALTNLFAALLGTLPNAIRGSNSARVILTGVASRRMGIYAGAILIAAALLPKIIALVVSIPRPVLVAFIVFMLSLLFVQGMRTVLSDGMDGRKAIVVGLSLWIGIGFQNQLIFPDLLTGTLKTLLSSGVTTGSICVIALTLLMDLMSTSRRRRLNIEMSMADLPKLDGFLRDFASRSGWDEASTGRLRSAGEETLTSLLTQEDESAGGLVAEVAGVPSPPPKKDSTGRRLAVYAQRADGSIELEFMAASEGENLEDRLAHLGDEAGSSHDVDADISSRLLRHYASSVQHRKYHDVDIVTVRVDQLRG